MFWLFYIYFVGIGLFLNVTLAWVVLRLGPGVFSWVATETSWEGGWETGLVWRKGWDFILAINGDVVLQIVDRSMLEAVMLTHHEEYLVSLKSFEVWMCLFSVQQTSIEKAMWHLMSRLEKNFFLGIVISLKTVQAMVRILYSLKNSLNKFW